jgi:hypothetical protein
MSTASNTVGDSEAEAPAQPGFVLRLKRLLVAPLILLQRLRKPKPAEDEEALADTRADTEDSTPAQTAPPLWRRALPYALVLLAGAAAGGGSIYWLSAKIVAHQSAQLAEQKEEVARLKGVLAGYDRMMLQNKKKHDEELGKRAELENRLAQAQSDLARKPAAAQSSLSAAGGGTAPPGKTGDCTLRPGSIGSTLKGCIEEFNRQ